MSASTSSAPPDPAAASSAVEFIGLLKELRMWAGQPSLRRLQRLAGATTAVNGDVVDALPTSSVSYVLRGRGLPRLPRMGFVNAYVAACLDAAGFAEDVEIQVERWRWQWRQLSRSTAVKAEAPPQSPTVPRQLPRDTTWFTGRDVQVESLLAASDPGPASAVVIWAIDGMAGSGKTALALHAAHRLVGRFPDGQIFIDLHGFTAGVPRVEPAEALDRLLRDLGLSGELIPAGLQERAALWRSLLTGRRMLLVLDNAATEAQVEPLLPGTAGCLVLVTSRRRLAALEACHIMSLDTLPESDAVKLFVRCADRPELTVDTPEAQEAVRLCGRLPLAIRIGAARLRHHPVWTVADLVGRLREMDARLQALDDGQRSVHTALQLSYRNLSPDAQRMYRLLGVHPGADADLYAAAALTACTVDEVRALLEALTNDHLLTESSPGRYRLHDLVRAHAADTAAREESSAQQRTALHRLLSYYRHTAGRAMTMVCPHGQQRRPTVPLAESPTPELANRIQAELWVGAELTNLLTAAKGAAAHGCPEYTWQISAILDRYLLADGRYGEAQPLHQNALDLARRLGDPAAEMNALTALANIHKMVGRHDLAGDQYQQAMRIAQDIGDRVGELAALTGLGKLLWTLGRGEQAGGICGLALRIAQDIGDRFGELAALVGLGAVQLRLGHHERAGHYFERALEITQDIGDRSSGMAVLIGLGHVHRILDRHSQAAHCYQQVFDIGRDLGSRDWQLEALQGLGRLHHATGHPALALTHHEQALRHATDLAQPADQARAHDGLAHAHYALRQGKQAHQHWQRALDILTDLGTNHTDDIEADVPSIRAHLAALNRPR